MEKDFKNITFFELPESFENDVMERIIKIKKKRKRAKTILLPAIFIILLSFTAFFLMDLIFEREKNQGKSLAVMERMEQEPHAEIYLESIPIKNFEKENRYLIEFVNEKDEEIHAF